MTNAPDMAHNPQKIEGGFIMADNARVRRNKRGWYVDVYISSQERHSIFYYMGEVGFSDNPELAKTAASVINAEITKGIWRPERWRKAVRRMFTVEGYSQNWLDQIKPSISGATLADYRNSFKNHINPVLGTEYIEDLNLSKTTLLLNSINRAPKGKKNVMDALKRMLRYAFQSSHILAPVLFPEHKGTHAVMPPEVRYVAPGDRLKILSKIPLRHRPIFIFYTLTGARTSEARAFRKVDIKPDHIMFAVTFGRDQELKEVKGKKVMPFPLTEALKELFRETPANLTPWVFVNPDTGREYNRNLQRDIFNPAAAGAGFPALTLTEFGRKSFAMEMLNSGLEKGMVSHLLRHQDQRMIDHYGEYQTTPLKAELDRVQGINDLHTKTHEVEKG